MFTRILSAVGLVAGLALGVATPASATTIDYFLTVDGCSSGCGASNYGTVQISDIAGGVSVSVTLAPGIEFVNTGALDGEAFVFSLTGHPDITITNLTTADFSVGDSTGSSPPDISAGGTFGSFDYGITCSGCGTGGSDPKAGPISFDISGVTTSMFTDGLKNGTETGIFFVVDIINTNTLVCNADNVCVNPTGRVGAPGGNIVECLPGIECVVTPEPITLSLFGAGLLGAVAITRRRRKLA
jgi:PEP-CTERM motif-containing protein